MLVSVRQKIFLLIYYPLDSVTVVSFVSFTEGAVVPNVPRLLMTQSGVKIPVQSMGDSMARQDNYRSLKAAWCVFSTGEIR